MTFAQQRGTHNLYDLLLRIMSLCHHDVVEICSIVFFSPCVVLTELNRRIGMDGILCMKVNEGCQ